MVVLPAARVELVGGPLLDALDRRVGSDAEAPLSRGARGRRGRAGDEDVAKAVRLQLRAEDLGQMVLCDGFAGVEV